MEPQTDTRTRIIETAGTLFYQQGFEAVGLQKICGQAKVSKSSFYHFFSSKSEVALAVINSHWQQAEAGQQQLLESPLSALDKLRASFETIFTMAEVTHAKEGKIYGCPFGGLASELACSNAEIRQQVQQVFDHLIEFYSTLVAQGIQEGGLPQGLDVMETAESLVALAQGLSVMGKVYNDPSRLRRIGEQGLNSLLQVS